MGERRIRISGLGVTAVLVLVLWVLLVLPANADVAIAGKAGTLGAGVELTAGLSRQLNARLGLNGYTYSDRREASGIEYDGDAKLRTATALLDWHPGGRGFRLTGGVVYNDSRLEGTSVPPPSGIYNIGGVSVPVSVVRTLHAKADFDPLVPYVGLGWGNAVAPERKIGFFVDLGVIFQGKADVTLTPDIPANSPVNTTPGAREALDILLRREERDLEKEAADYQRYPVVAIGLSYRF